MDPEAETLPVDVDEETFVIDDGPIGMYQVWMLAISLSILQVGFGIVTPIFPYYIESLGMAGIELGVLAASFAIARIILAGPMGRLSDRVGRKPVLILSLFGFALSNIVYAFAYNVIVMLSARALEGAVSAGFFPAANAFVSDVTTPKNRGTAMGYLSMGNMVGFIVGPALGGFLAQFLGFRIPFLLAAVATLVTMVLVHVLVDEPVKKTIKESIRKVPLREILARAQRCYGILGIAMFANMFAMGILEVAFMLDAVINLGIEPYEIGMFFGVIGITMMIGNLGFGKLSDIRGRKWLIVIGAMIGAVSLVMFIFARNPIDLLAAGMVLSIGMSMRGPAIQALIADVTDPSAYGVLMGAFGAVSNSAYAVSPLLGGRIFDETGSAALSLLIASGVSVAGGVAAMFLPGEAGQDTCVMDAELAVDGIEHADDDSSLTT
ncbi:MAG: MFS transporter [Candidatus Thorarchaeota archaeon]